MNVKDLKSKTLIEALPEVKFKLISMHACMHEHRLMTVMAMQSCLTYTDRRSFHSTTDSLATLLVNTLTLAAIYIDSIVPGAILSMLSIAAAN